MINEFEEELDEFDEGYDEEETASLIPYTLLIHFHCEWTASSGVMTDYDLALPLAVSVNNNISLVIPYCKDIFKITHVDKELGAVEIDLSLQELYHFSLGVGSIETFPFSYLHDENDENSYREGEISFSLRKDDFVITDEVKGEIEIKETLTNLSNEERIAEEKGVIFNISNEDDGEVVTLEKVTENAYFAWLINKEKDFIVFQATHRNEDEDVINYAFIPLFRGQATHFYDSWISDDDELLFEEVNVSFKN